MNKSTWMQVLGALALLLGGVMLMPAGRAGAHAEYESSTPAKDEVVPAAPAQVDVFFKQEVLKQAGANYVRVFAGDGATQVSAGDGAVDDDNRRHISAAMPADAAQGRYIVRWMTTSDEDGETDSGAFCFYIGVQPAPAQQAECASFAPTAVPAIAGTAQPVATQEITPLPTSDDTPSPDEDGSSTRLIIGIVAGIIVAVVVVGGGGFLLNRQS